MLINALVLMVQEALLLMRTRLLVDLGNLVIGDGFLSHS